MNFNQSKMDAENILLDVQHSAWTFQREEWPKAVATALLLLLVNLTPKGGFRLNQAHDCAMDELL